ncbi:MAG: RibD family protein [Filomicrobium sp.]
MSISTNASIEKIRNAPDIAPFVVAQLGQSLDGRIATPTGESRWINKDAALDHLHALRMAVDAVVVGIGTVLADDPQLTVRRFPIEPDQQQPARVIIDPSGRLPADAKVLNNDGSPCLRITNETFSQSTLCETIPLKCDDGSMCPNAIVSTLFERGFKRLLIEGGAMTVSRFIDAQAINRLHVLVAPMLIGSGKTGVELAPIDKLTAALRPPADVYVLPDGDVLFDCDLAAIRASS